MSGGEYPSPEKTPDEIRKEDREFHNRIYDFAARYPWVGWVCILVLAPYLLWRAYKESQKSA